MANPRIDPGTLVGGRFRVELLAGSGGMGEVYRGRDEATGQSVAIKFVHATNLAPRFLREARVLSQLDHPGIVRYVAHGDAPSIFLVMEWLEGEDLGVRLARGALSACETVALARGVVDALATAHVRGVVHRDIKPSNIFLHRRVIEQPKLLDFGIAAFAEGTRVMTVTGQVLGTLGYMAPEQASSGRVVTARADVFSLGCVLFECVTGRPAFPGDRLMEVLAKILFADVPRASDVRNDVPCELDELLLRMMAKEPDARPSLAAIATELETLADLDPVSTAAPTRRANSLPPRAPSFEASGITDAERRLMAVVLADPSAGARVRPTSPTLSVAQIRDVEQALTAAIAPFEGRLELLAQGATLVVLGATEIATDLAARAARVGLAVRRVLPGAPVAVTLGKGDPSAEQHLGELVNRGEKILERVLARGPAGCAVWLDDVVAGLLDRRFDVADSEGVRELRGERGGAGGARTLLGKETPCVGRDRELSIMQAVADECFAEPVAAALVVTGDAGTGKTRVANEFLRALVVRSPSAEVWSTRGDSIAAGSSLSMLGRLLHGIAGLADGEAAETRREKLLARAGRRLGADDALRVAELFGDLVGARFPDEGRATLRAARQDASLMGDQLRRAWEDFVAAETAAAPVVLVLDDLQWGDRSTVRFVDSALKTLHDRPFLAVALGRPEMNEMFPGLFRERRVHEVRLAELTTNAARRLATHVLGDRASRAAVDAIVEKAGGNAFYLEELVRSLAEGVDALPETVLAMAQARLERLAPEARRLLRAASVFGRTFWPSGVGALLGSSGLGGRGEATRRANLDATIDALVKAEVIARAESSRFESEPEYSFLQLLVRDAAYGMLTERDRKLGHKLAADWLESRGERDAIVLAEHLDRGGHARNAVVWYLWAAEQAFEGNDLSAVIARAERGVTCGASGGTLGELRLLQAEAIGWSGKPETFEQHARHADAAVALLEPGTGAWCRAAAELAIAKARQRDVGGLAEIAERIVAIPPDATVGQNHAFAMARTAIESFVLGLSEPAARATAWVEKAAVAAHPDDTPIIGTVARWLRAMRALFEGDVDPMLREGPGIVDALEAGGYSRYTVIVALYLSAACAANSDPRAGLGWVDRAAQVSERLGLASYADLVPSHRTVHEAAISAAGEPLEDSTFPAGADGHATRVLERILSASSQNRGAPSWPRSD